MGQTLKQKLELEKNHSQELERINNNLREKIKKFEEQQVHCEKLFVKQHQAIRDARSLNGWLLEIINSKFTIGLDLSEKIPTPEQFEKQTKQGE